MDADAIEARILIGSGIVWLAASLLAFLGAVAFLGIMGATNDDGYMAGVVPLAFAGLLCGMVAAGRLGKARRHARDGA